MLSLEKVNYTIGTDLEQPLPAPPPGASPADIVCTSSLDPIARRACAAQVYIALYNSFEAEFGRQQPTVRDLIRIFLALELLPDPERTKAPADLLAATAHNLYYSYCVVTRPEGCDLYDVIDFLGTSDGWIQIGGLNGIIPDAFSNHPDSLIERMKREEVVNNLPQGEQLTGFRLYNSQVPLAWGNYYYGTEGYNQFTTSNGLTELYCELVRLVVVKSQSFCKNRAA